VEARLVSRKAIAVAGLSAVAIAASGCGGDSDPDAELRAAFEKNFSTAPWIHHITGMEVADGSGRPHIKVTTELGPENNGSETASTICSAAINFAFESGAVDEIPEGEVIGSDGVGLGGCA
jgi:hypothetical protein